MAKGFVYLTALVEWASRKMSAAKIAITLEACHAVYVRPFAWHGRLRSSIRIKGASSLPRIIRAVHACGCKLSMDGRVACRDNVFIERLWRPVKYEEVYLHAYDSVNEARRSIMRYLDWYNRLRPHSRIKRKAPDEAYTVMLPTVELAA